MLEGKIMRKILIILGCVITVILISFAAFVFINSKEEVLTSEEKQMLISNLSIDNESILTSGKAITIEADLKNNNDKDVRVKQIDVTLFNDYEKTIKKFTIKIDKVIKSNKNSKFIKTIQLDNTETRVFTKYKISI